jgi:hypothetical protein
MPKLRVKKLGEVQRPKSPVLGRFFSILMVVPMSQNRTRKFPRLCSGSYSVDRNDIASLDQSLSLGQTRKIIMESE